MKTYSRLDAIKFPEDSNSILAADVEGEPESIEPERTTRMILGGETIGAGGVTTSGRSFAKAYRLRRSVSMLQQLKVETGAAVMTGDIFQNSPSTRCGCSACSQPSHAILRS